jgi:hypothetical protein
MREFVRYSPGIEAPDPNFESALHTVLEDLRQQVTASPKFDGGVAIRNAHAKGYGRLLGPPTEGPPLPGRARQRPDRASAWLGQRVRG